MDREKGKCGIYTKITRPNTVRLFLWVALKNTVYTSKPPQDLRGEIEIACDAAPLGTIQN
jgi:hypothetical protein